jgi:hypothetical protein
LPRSLTTSLPLYIEVDSSVLQQRQQIAHPRCELPAASPLSGIPVTSFSNHVVALGEKERAEQIRDSDLGFGRKMSTLILSGDRSYLISTGLCRVFTRLLSNGRIRQRPHAPPFVDSRIGGSIDHATPHQYVTCKVLCSTPNSRGTNRIDPSRSLRGHKADVSER